MALTDPGQHYLIEAKRILADVDALTARIAKTREEPRGKLKLGLSTACGKLIILPQLPEFKRRYPEISMEIHLE